MNVHIRFENVTVNYGAKTALDDVSLEIPEKQILGIIGPAGSGKTSLLRCINRTIDFVSGARVRGRVLIAAKTETDPTDAPLSEDRSSQTEPPPATPVEDILRIRNVYALRRRVGMVFPLPVGLPLSVYENVAYAPRRAGVHERHELDMIVETCLRQAMLWDEVKDRMQMLGTKLSGGQQQRLTLARALSLRPEILCLDEFSIAIDPVTTMRIEDILRELKSEMTIVLVTNLVQQARRLADRTAFFSAGRLVEVDETEKIFTKAADRLTERYVTGDVG
jgi:phosphate transport system ATP-binding protein